jgi:hypothetical protein
LPLLKEEGIKVSGENKFGYRDGFWKAHSAGWKASGLNQEAYCKQEGISFRSFLYQHNRLVNQPKEPVINFVKAKPELAPANSQMPVLQLQLPNGVKISIASEVNAALLQTVLTIAGDLPC